MPKPNLDELTRAKRAELKVLDDLIAERKRYYRDQEALIDELVERGNTKLMGLTHDIALSKQELRELKTDKRLLIQDKVMLSNDLVIIQRQISIESNGIAIAYA